MKISEKTYYQKNKEVILNRAKKYYEDHKKRLRDQARDKYRNLSKEKKIRENMEERDTVICLKKRHKD